MITGRGYDAVRMLAKESGFRSAVASGAFSAASEIAGIADAELAGFRARLDASRE